MADNAPNLISTATASPDMSPNAPNTAGVVNIGGIPNAGFMPELKSEIKTLKGK